MSKPLAWFKRLKERYQSREFFKNFMTLFSGSLLAQAIPLLVIPILTRLYSSEIFGVYFVYSALVIVLSTLSTMQYEMAIVLPKEDEESTVVLLLSLIISVVISLLTAVFICVFYDLITDLLGERAIGKWVYVLPLSMFFLGVIQSLTNWANRHKFYRDMSRGRVIKALGTNGTQLGIGVSSLQYLGMIPGLITGQLVGAFYFIFHFRKIIRHAFRHLSLRQLYHVAVKHRNLPLFNTIIGLVNKFSNHLPIFMLTRYFGLSTASYYGVSHRIINASAGLFLQSAGEVFYQKATEYHNKKIKLFPLVWGMYKNLFRIGILPYTLMIFIAPAVYRIILGTEWHTAGIYTQILIPWLFTFYLNAPLTYVFTILSKQFNMVIYYTLLLIARFLALYLGYHLFHNVYIALALFSGVGLVFGLMLMAYLLHISRR